jgi:aryl-alcohol dehydrogenase-like predicted oxidoreductase
VGRPDALQETLAALDDLVHAGKVRYAGCSNYTGWQLMKALGVADRHQAKTASDRLSAADLSLLGPHLARDR